MNVSQLLDFTTQRALNADESISGVIDPIVANARRLGQRKVDQTTTALSRQAGSGANTIVQQLGLEGQAEMESQLASLAATLNLQGREQATGELTAAAGGAGELNVQLGNILKGATQTVSGEQVSVQESQTQQLTEALSSIVGNMSSTELQSLVNTLTESTQVNREISEQASGSGRSSSRSAGLGLG